MPRTPHLWTATCRSWIPGRANELQAVWHAAERRLRARPPRNPLSLDRGMIVLEGTEIVPLSWIEAVYERVGRLIGHTFASRTLMSALRMDAEPIGGFVLHDGRRLERGDEPPAPVYPTAQAESDLLSKIGKASGLAATLPAVEVTRTELTPLDGKMRMGGLPFDTQLHFPARIAAHRGDIIRISQPPDAESPGFELVHVVAIETCVRQRKCQRGVVVRGFGGTPIRPFPDRAACEIIGHNLADVP